MQTVGVDIGTTTISAVVLDIDNRAVIETRTVDNGSFIETEHSWERIQDPEVIVSKAKAVLDELLTAYPDVRGIGLTGQMHGILYTDGTGRAVSPLYTWQDQRAMLSEDGDSVIRKVTDKTEVKLAAGYGLATHLYQLGHGLVPQGAESLCTIPDYLGMILTGRKTPLMHISMAASIGFFDIDDLVFMVNEFAMAGGDPDILPEVSDSIVRLGEYRGYPVSVAIGDNQASFLGSVGYEKDTLLLNVGTGGQVSVLSEKPFEAPGIEARPYTKDSYLLVGSSLCGGRAYAILEKFFRSYVLEVCGTEMPQYDVMERLALRAMSEENGMKVRTTFKGTRVDPDLRGSIENISEESFTPEGLIAGVMKGLLDELYDMYIAVSSGTGIRVQKVIGSGNGIRKNKVMQKIAQERFNAELSLALYKEEAACGAAISSSYVA